MRPRSVAERAFHAMALMRVARNDDARAVLEHAVQDMPRSLELRTLLARLLATAPEEQVHDAGEALTQAKDLLRRQVTLSSVETMAMAKAASGDFAAAVAWQRAAADAAATAGKLEELPWIGERLRTYEATRLPRRPWADGEPESQTASISVAAPAPSGGVRPSGEN